MQEKGAMLTKDEYYEKLIACRHDHLNFVDMTQSLTDKVLVEKLDDEFKILFAFKEACAHLYSVSYKDNTKLCVLAKEMSMLEMSSLEQWKAIERFRRTRSMLYAPVRGEMSQVESTGNCLGCSEPSVLHQVSLIPSHRITSFI